MDLKEYQELVNRTAKKDFATKEEEIMCWGLGVTGEAGDVASCIKKTFIHKNDKKDGIKENIGDMFWYAAMVCNFFDWNMQELLEANIKKLKERYPQGFTEKDAQRQGQMIDWNEDKIK